MVPKRTYFKIEYYKLCMMLSNKAKTKIQTKKKKFFKQKLIFNLKNQKDFILLSECENYVTVRH